MSGVAFDKPRGGIGENRSEGDNAGGGDVKVVCSVVVWGVGASAMGGLCDGCVKMNNNITMRRRTPRFLQMARI